MLETEKRTIISVRVRIQDFVRWVGEGEVSAMHRIKHEHGYRMMKTLFKLEQYSCSTVCMCVCV